MANDEEIRGLRKAIQQLNSNAKATAMGIAKSDAAAAAMQGAVGDLTNIPLFKSAGSAASFLGGKAVGKIKEMRGKSGESKEEKSSSETDDGDNEALQKIKETNESQLQIQEGNEEEEKIERVKNDESRREETAILTQIKDGIETLVDNALNPKVAEAEGGGFLAGILGMLFGGLSIGNMLTSIMKPFAIFKKGFLKIGTFFKSIGTKIGNIPKMLSKAFPFMKNIGRFMTRVVGKLFIPLTILLSAFDFIKGFLAGFKEGGIIEGIKQGFMGLISGFVDSLLNMLKGAFSWIARKLGFEELANILDSFTFDFAGLFGQVFDKVKTFITEKIMPFVTEMFTGLFTKANTFLTETVLPWVTGFWEGLSFGNIMETIDEFLIQPLSSMFNSIIDFFKNIELPSLEDITAMIPGFDSIKGMLGFGDDDEKSTGSVVDSIVQNAEGMAMSAEELVSAIFDKIAATGSSAAGAVMNTVNNISSGGDSTTVIPTGFDTKSDPLMARWISDF